MDMNSELITTKQSITSLGVAGGSAATSQHAITANDLASYVFLGMELGAWLWVFAFFTALCVAILNIPKIYKLLNKTAWVTEEAEHKLKHK